MGSPTLEKPKDPPFARENPGALPQDLGNTTCIFVAGCVVGGGENVGGEDSEGRRPIGEEPWRGRPGEERCLPTGPTPSLSLAGMDQLTFPEAQRQPLSAPQ